MPLEHHQYELNTSSCMMHVKRNKYPFGLIKAVCVQQN